MNRMSRYLLTAWEKGYRVLPSGKVRSPQGNMLVLCANKLGYLHFCIRYGSGRGERREVMVHRLAAYQKYGKRLFEEGIQVRHLDGNSLNNSFENIAIGTRSQNMMDIPVEVRVASAKKAASKRRALTDEQVKMIREKHAEGEWKYKDIMEKFGIAKSTVSYVVNRKTYSTVELL